jgi:hypothetical protein
MHVMYQEGGHAVNWAQTRQRGTHILAARDPEKSLELALFLDPELMVGAGQVELGENA